MKATGEVMAIDRTFEAALRRRSAGWSYVPMRLLGPVLPTNRNPNQYPANDVRLWRLLDALRVEGGRHVEGLHADTGIDRWFLAKLRHDRPHGAALAARPLRPLLRARSTRILRSALAA